MKRNPERVGQSPALELGRMWIALLAIRKENGGERKVAETLGTNIIAGVMINSYILPTYRPTDNDRFGFTFPRSVSKENFAVTFNEFSVSVKRHLLR